VRNTSSTSWVVQRLAPVLRHSVFGRAAAWSVGVERHLRTQADARLRERRPRLSLASVAPIVREAWLSRVLMSVWTHVNAAFEHSAVVGHLASRTREIQRVELATRVRAVAVIAGTAALTHVALLVFVEPYPYPRRTALALPVIVFVLAACVTRYSDLVANAIRERRARRR
jgi:hypothetical protein